MTPAWALAGLAIAAALAVPIVASIRAASRPTMLANEAPAAPATSQSSLVPKSIPGQGALPLCPTTRVVRPVSTDVIPSVEAGPGEGPDPGDRLTPKGRL